MCRGPTSGPQACSEAFEKEVVEASEAHTTGIEAAWDAYKQEIDTARAPAACCV